MQRRTATMVAPRLLTERLVLRGITIADFEPSLALWQEEAVYRHIGGVAQSRADRWARFQRGPAMWVLLGYGFWAVEQRDDGTYVGEIGFGAFMREMDPPLPDLPEMGWVMHPTTHGQGLASEALAVALNWGDAAMPGTRFQCIISPDNAPSLRLATRHGFCEVRRATLREDDRVIVLERPAPRTP